MGVGQFDVLLRDAASGATMKREWSTDELLKSVLWLKRMNARGNDIYVRPSGEHGLVLLDSITAENIANMCANGFAPAVTVEVNGNEFQAWMKLSDRTLPEPLRRLIQAWMARAFCDTQSTLVPDRYGRLAGCVNHHGSADEPKRRKYVLAHPGSVEIGKPSRDYVEHATKILQKSAKEQESKGQAQRHSYIANPHSHHR